MAIVVEDGTGKSDANSFVDLAAYKAYHDLRGNDYSAYSDAVMNASLVRAGQYLNAMNFLGYKSNKNQAMCFPRRAQADYYSRYYYVDEFGPGGGIVVGGYEIGITEIPQPIKDAQCEAAFIEMVTPGAFLGEQAVGVKSETIDVLSFEYDLNAGSGFTSYPAVDMLLGPYLQSSIVGKLVRS